MSELSPECAAQSEHRQNRARGPVVRSILAIVHRATARATGRGPGESLRVQKRLGPA
jgi:hypothetical protein